MNIDELRAAILRSISASRHITDDDLRRLVHLSERRMATSFLHMPYGNSYGVTQRKSVMEWIAEHPGDGGEGPVRS